MDAIDALQLDELDRTWFSFLGSLVTQRTY